MARPKSCLRTQIVDLHKAGVGYRTIGKQLGERQQLLVQLLENGRNSRWLLISLGLGLYARSRLVEYQWSWERWRISLELHGINTRERKVPLLKPAHVQARLKFVKDHLDDPEEAWEKVMWSWDQNITFWYKLHSPCLEEEGWVQSQEHHPNREAWGWKHHALGVLFCKGESSMEGAETPCCPATAPKPERSGQDLYGGVGLLQCEQTWSRTTGNVWPL